MYVMQHQLQSWEGKRTSLAIPGCGKLVSGVLTALFCSWGFHGWMLLSVSNKLACFDKGFSLASSLTGWLSPTLRACNSKVGHPYKNSKCTKMAVISNLTSSPLLGGRFVPFHCLITCSLHRIPRDYEHVPADWPVGFSLAERQNVTCAVCCLSCHLYFMYFLFSLQNCGFQFRHMFTRATSVFAF